MFFVFPSHYALPFSVTQEAVGDKQPPKWKKKEIFDVTKSFHNCMVKVRFKTSQALIGERGKLFFWFA